MGDDGEGEGDAYECEGVVASARDAGSMNDEGAMSDVVDDEEKKVDTALRLHRTNLQAYVECSREERIR